MNQEHKKSQPKDQEEEISFPMPPIDCCRQYLLRLAHQELDTTIKSVLCEIRSLAWDKSNIPPEERLIKIGKIADAFHNWGANPPSKIVDAMLNKFVESHNDQLMRWLTKQLKED